MSHRVVSFPTARIPTYQDPVEVAFAGINQYINDLISEANAATTTRRAVQIRNGIADLTGRLIGAEMVAANRDEQLVKEM